MIEDSFRRSTNDDNLFRYQNNDVFKINLDNLNTQGSEWPVITIGDNNVNLFIPSCFPYEIDNTTIRGDITASDGECLLEVTDGDDTFSIDIYKMGKKQQQEALLYALGQFVNRKV